MSDTPSLLATPAPSAAAPDPTAGLPTSTTPVSVTPRAKEARSSIPLTESVAASAPPASTEALATHESESSASQTETDSTSSSTEAERRKELEPEIEKTVEKIKNSERQKPNETVVASDSIPQTAPNTVAQPVVVLPLTQEGMQKAKTQSVQTSVRWLYEWCVRQVQKFSKIIVVYRKKSEDET